MLLNDDLCRRKMHRKRRRPPTTEVSAMAFDQHVFHRRLLVLFLCVKLFSAKLIARVDGDNFVCDLRTPYRSKRLLFGFGFYQPQLRNHRRWNHDRRGPYERSGFVSNSNPRKNRKIFVPLVLSESLDGENDNGIVESNRFDAVQSTTVVQSLEFMQTIILQQQRQIDTLLQLLQQQRSPAMNAEFAVTGDLYGPNQSPLLFQPLSPQVIRNATTQLISQSASMTEPIGVEQHSRANQKVLKAMLFIDGTWLYYSIHERLAKDCSIIQKYGRGWQHRYDIDWAKLPSLLCQTMQREILEQMKEATGTESFEQVQIHLVRSSVYTSYKADTPTTSYRYKLFQELQKANYHVHMMETVGKSEKCVDIQLAVEILHYATMENPSTSYDIALLLTGDKDLMPAIIRTRCKGKRVGLVSMRPGCNRALVDTPGLLDFDVIWMEDFLDQLVVPRLFHDGDLVMSEANTGNDSSLPTSLYALHKVVYDFIKCSGLPRVSSRDLGRYLKQLFIGSDGGTTLLDTMKRYYGGLYQYLSSMGYYDCELPTFTHNAADHSYWISLTERPVHGDDEYVAGVDDFRFDDPLVEVSLTEEEKQFFSTYTVEPLVTDRNTLYMHSIERLFNSTGGELSRSYFRYDAEKIQRVPVLDRAGNVNGLKYNGELHSQSQILDYNSMTVVELKEVCRERGLAVSGTKAALLSRIQDSIVNDETSSQHSEEKSPPHLHGDPIAVYLKELVVEYLHAKGGVANSRMIGRYLAANKSSPRNQNQANNALKEMKSLYGSLNSFVATFPDTFISFRDNRNNSNSNDASPSSSGIGGNYDFGFSIALKNKIEKDRA